MNGSGFIARVYLRALRATSGTSPTLANIKLVDRNAQEISKTLINSGRCTIVISDTAPPYTPPLTDFLWLPLVRK